MYPKFYISYFYHVRNLKPNQIPLSTAKYPPKWFMNPIHPGSNINYLDKRSVINGLEIEEFIPKMEHIDCSSCIKDYSNPDSNPLTCRTMTGYYDQLCKIDKTKLLDYLIKLSGELKSTYGYGGETEYVLMVFETPDNPCSERSSIMRWFIENNIPIKEYNPKED